MVATSFTPVNCFFQWLKCHFIPIWWQFPLVLLNIWFNFKLRYKSFEKSWTKTHRDLIRDVYHDESLWNQIQNITHLFRKVQLPNKGAESKPELLQMREIALILIVSVIKVKWVVCSIHSLDSMQQHGPVHWSYTGLSCTAFPASWQLLLVASDIDIICLTFLRWAWEFNIENKLSASLRLSPGLHDGRKLTIMLLVSLSVWLCGLCLCLCYFLSIISPWEKEEINN